jgi:hypothetical protein
MVQPQQGYWQGNQFIFPEVQPFQWNQKAQPEAPAPNQGLLYAPPVLPQQGGDGGQHQQQPNQQYTYYGDKGWLSEADIARDYNAGGKQNYVDGVFQVTDDSGKPVGISGLPNEVANTASAMFNTDFSNNPVSQVTDKVGGFMRDVTQPVRDLMSPVRDFAGKVGQGIMGFGLEDKTSRELGSSVKGMQDRQGMLNKASNLGTAASMAFPPARGVGLLANLASMANKGRLSATINEISQRHGNDINNFVQSQFPGKYSIMTPEQVAQSLPSWSWDNEDEVYGPPAPDPNVVISQALAAEQGGGGWADPGGSGVAPGAPDQSDTDFGGWGAW